jgi:hypothetical protein
MMYFSWCLCVFVVKKGFLNHPTLREATTLREAASRLRVYGFASPPTLTGSRAKRVYVTGTGATAVDGFPGIKHVASKTGAGLTKTRRHALF